MTKRTLAILIGALSCGLAQAATTQLAPGLTMTVARPLPRRQVIYQRGPAVAYGNGVYLLVWQEGYNGMGGNSDILGMRFNADGKPLDRKALQICTQKAVQDTPVVAFCAGNFLVAWSDLRNGKDYDVYAVLVASNGRVEKEDGSLLCGGKGGQARPAIASNGKDAFLAVWQDFRSGKYFSIAAARVLARDGAVVDKGGFIAMERGERPSVTWIGGRYMIAQRWYAALVGNDGKVAMEPKRIWKGKQVLYPAVTAAWGRGFAFLNTNPRHDPWGWGGNGAVIGASIFADGSSPELDTIKRLRSMSALKADGKVKNCLDAARWRGYKGWPMGRPGGFKNTEEGTWPSGPLAAAFNGRSVVVAWTRAKVIDKSRLGQRDIYLRRVLKDWAYADSAKIKIVAGPTDESNPALAAGRPGDTFLAYERVLPDGGIVIEYRLIREADK
jgi:hypothetical protein